MRNGSLLGSDLLEAALDVWNKVALVHSWHEERSVGEEIVHLLERTLGSLGKEAVEEDGIGEIANLRSG